MDRDTSRKNQRKPGLEPILLTIPEVARLLRLSNSAVYALLEYRCPGGIPVKRFGRSVRVSLSELRDWVAQH